MIIRYGFFAETENKVEMFPTALWNSLWHSSDNKWTLVNPWIFAFFKVNLALVSPVIAAGNSECNSKASHASAFMLLSPSALLEAIEQHRFLELFHADWLLFPVNWELHLGSHGYVSKRSWEDFSGFLKTMAFDPKLAWLCKSNV